MELVAASKMRRAQQQATESRAFREAAHDILEKLSGVSDVDVLIFNGGTGIAPRDTTYDALAGLLEKIIPGFGELFRWLS